MATSHSAPLQVEVLCWLATNSYAPAPARILQVEVLWLATNFSDPTGFVNHVDNCPGTGPVGNGTCMPMFSVAHW